MLNPLEADINDIKAMVRELDNPGEHKIKKLGIDNRRGLYHTPFGVTSGVFCLYNAYRAKTNAVAILTAPAGEIIRMRKNSVFLINSTSLLFMSVFYRYIQKDAFNIIKASQGDIDVGYGNSDLSKTFNVVSKLAAKLINDIEDAGDREIAALVVANNLKVNRSKSIIEGSPMQGMSPWEKK